LTRGCIKAKPTTGWVYSKTGPRGGKGGGDYFAGTLQKGKEKTSKKRSCFVRVVKKKLKRKKVRTKTTGGLMARVSGFINRRTERGGAGQPRKKVIQGDLEVGPRWTEGKIIREYSR